MIATPEEVAISEAGGRKRDLTLDSTYAYMRYLIVKFARPTWMSYVTCEA